MRIFETSTPLDISRQFVDTHLLKNPTAWSGLLLWSEGDSNRLTAILERNPPLTELAEYVKTSTATIKPTMCVKIIEYGKHQLLQEFVKSIQINPPQYHHNPHWLFSRFPNAYAPTVRRTLAKYTNEVLAEKDGEMLMVKSFHYNLDAISDAVLHTPRSLEQTKRVVLEIAKAINNDKRDFPSVRKNLNKIVNQLSEEHTQQLNDYMNFAKVDLKLALTSKSKPQSIIAPEVIIKTVEAEIPKLDAWQISQMWKKSRLDDTTVKILIHNTKPDAKDYMQRTLLERVVLQGLTTSFEAAVNAGGNLKHKDYRGANLAHKACHSKRKAMLKMVMDAGVNPWEPDGRGMVCLHKIALESPNMIQMLLAHPEANPNAVDETGSTALFYLFPIQSTWAQKVVALKSVNTLLELGVDPNIRNKMGQTFLDIARSRSSTSANTTLTKMLEETVDRFQNYKLAVTLDDIVGSPATASRKKM